MLKIKGLTGSHRLEARMAAAYAPRSRLTSSKAADLGPYDGNYYLRASGAGRAVAEDGTGRRATIICGVWITAMT